MAGERPVTIAIAAMGGQGGGVLADWIVDLAEHNGCYAQSTSVPGVAQRTGATVYYLEIFPRGDGTDDRSPVMALMPVPGDVDIVIAGELVEAGRAVLRGFVTPDRTCLISSSHRDYALSEKMAMGDGRVDWSRLQESTARAAKRFIAFDMATLANEKGSVISSVLFGALAGSGALPFSREQFEQTIERGGLAVKASLAGFTAGYELAGAGVQRDTGTEATTVEAPSSAGLESLLDRIQREFPQAAQGNLILGIRRLRDYQDVAYANEYLERVARVLAADTDGGRNGELTAEVARYLALWMSYEDTLRVAQVKIDPARIARIRSEARAGEGQIVHVVEFMHPRVQEICDTMPALLGRLVLGTPPLRGLLGLFCRSGRRIRTTGPFGYLLLYGLSRLRPMRRRTLRHQREMQAIDGWLARIRSTAPSNYDLAVEIARCQRLVKGYGDTHERGLGNFNSLMQVMDRIAASPDPAQLLRELRDHALADEHGEVLKESLKNVA